MATKVSGHLFLCYLGLPGAGKTLLSTEEQLIVRYKSGQRVASNFFINLKGITYYEGYEFIYLRNCVLFQDEIGQILDPYNWKDLPYEVRQFYQNHRKLHNDIISTTQDVSFISKPARVLISEWYYCENNAYGEWLTRLLTYFHLPEIRIKIQAITSRELEKLQKGVGASPLVDTNDEDEESFSEDLNLSELETPLENPVKHKSFSYRQLAHRELDDFKIELVHRYCPDCASRQGEQILKDDTLKVCDYSKKRGYSLKVAEFCPSHPLTQLIVKETGLYDTDYLIEPKDIKVEWRAYVPIKQGALKVPYKGALSAEMIKERSMLPKSL